MVRAYHARSALLVLLLVHAAGCTAARPPEPSARGGDASGGPGRADAAAPGAASPPSSAAAVRPVDHGDAGRVVAGAGEESLRLVLSGEPLRIKAGERCNLRLAVENVGKVAVAVGPGYALRWRHRGEVREDGSGPRAGALHIGPGKRLDVAGWAFGERDPGVYEVEVVYRAPDRPKKEIVSNTLRFEVE